MILIEKKIREKEAHETTSNIVCDLQREIESLRCDLASQDKRDGANMDGNSWDDSVPPHLLRLEELHQDLSRLRQENKGSNLSFKKNYLYLKNFAITIIFHILEILEAHEELQAQMLNKGLETGRSLLGPPPQSSLAAELTEMSNDQVCIKQIRYIIIYLAITIMI